MTGRSIVCGIDGSTDARVAVRLAAELARELDARLVVAHVVQSPAPPFGLEPATGTLSGVSTDALLAAGEALVDRVLAEEQLRDAAPRAVFGFPAEALADIADEEAAALIVVGSRGRGAFKAAFLGSVSTELIGLARCPVLVVPRAAGASERQTAARRSTRSGDAAVH